MANSMDQLDARPASNEEWISYGIDVGSALNVLSGNIFSRPSYYVRELISNSIDSMTKVAKKRAVKITLIENKSLKIRDYGSGMPRNVITDVLPIFFKSTKSNKDTSYIGQFGIGLYAALQHASRVTVRSKSHCSARATTAVLDQNGMKIKISKWTGPGTEVVVHFNECQQTWPSSSADLASFVEETFPFAAVDIIVNRRLVAGPSRFQPPWMTECSGERWLSIRKQKKNLANYFPHAIRAEGEVAEIALFLSSRRILSNNRSIKLFLRRVLVSSDYLPNQIDEVASFLVGVINAKSMDLTIARDSVIKGSSSAHLIDEAFFETLGKGLANLAHDNTRLFREFIDEHRSTLLMTCSRVATLRQHVQNVLLFRTLGGSWRPLSEALKYNKAYFVDRPDQFGDGIGGIEEQLPIFVFETDAELAFLTCLLSGSMKDVNWYRIDEAASDEQSTGFGYYAQQITDAIGKLGNVTTKVANGECLVSSWSMSRSISSVQIVMDDGSDRVAWIVPTLRAGHDRAKVWEAARTKVLKQCEFSESSSRFQSTVRKEAHESGYHRVLSLNYANPIVQALIETIGSPASADQHLGAVVLAALLATARSVSAKDWFIWTSDLDDNARCLNALSTIALSSAR